MEKLVSGNIRHVHRLDRNIFLPDVVDDDRHRRYRGHPGFCDGYHVPGRRW